MAARGLDLRVGLRPLLAGVVMTMTKYRSELNVADMPRSVRALPTDSRGYPIPWFVDWVTKESGERVPEFRAMNPHRWKSAVLTNLCWVCGEPKRHKDGHVFVVGPMCGINRTTAEPACHPDCAKWSALNCPFLSRPQMVRREDDVINSESLAANAPGLPLDRNPGVTLCWATRSFVIFKDPSGKPLLQMGDPYRLDFYASGRTATADEIRASVDSGLPRLEEIAALDPGGSSALRTARQRFERLVWP